MTHPDARRVSLPVLLLSASALAGCATAGAKPPIIANDDATPPVQAVSAAEPPRPVEVVAIPQPLPLPGQLKRVVGAPRIPEPVDPRDRVGIANAAARVQPVKDGFLNAIQQYPYADGALYQVYTAPGQVTDIALEEGEQLAGSGPVAAGDTVRWIIGDTESGSGPTKRVHILVKPTRPDLTTNLVINTTQRTYHLELRATAATYMASVSWTYPQDQLIALRRNNAAAASSAPVASGVDVAALNFRYAVTGDDAPWKPLRAFDDGRQVFIEFPAGIAQGEMPPLFVVGSAGGGELVNYRVHGRYMVVDRLFGAAELRMATGNRSRRCGSPVPTARAGAGHERRRARIACAGSLVGRRLPPAREPTARDAAVAQGAGDCRRRGRPRHRRFADLCTAPRRATSCQGAIQHREPANRRHHHRCAEGLRASSQARPTAARRSRPTDPLGRAAPRRHAWSAGHGPAGQSAQANAAAETRQRVLQERDAARTSKLFLSSVNPPAAAPLLGLAEQPAAASPAATPTTQPEDASPNGQAAKRAFLKDDGDRRAVSAERLVPPPSPYLVQAGSVIAAALITGLRSDLPGQITAQVTQNVYDSPTGRILLIPQGSKLIGAYDSSVSFGQSRVLLAWARLILPDGRSIALERQPGADAAGYAGLEDGVNNHWGKLFKAALLSTMLSVGSEAGTSQSENNLAQALRAGAANGFSQAGQQIVERELNIQPTLTIRPGFPVRVIVTRDLVLAPAGAGQ